ncbi:hypothetical protein PHYSODRAFT_336398 [Phytophthora sojae]|uniref:Uncharacterized protein n=1 Tax=Phytophthora sojae (strain P6497) TaxID=1094619 RepID=G4ZXV2_PHYSP|nr:hypothetical protein PHYSODRAFT_336398 [Phytophthora sojae]EGZ11910.1 hypothetical protein PHYSODRAFT_336398 [Phytophthora sojae]|eukprot:XP_009532243.1 hypothetical protein PHYSODRAFT_336398 [Phytophthora sojae]
MCDCNCKLDCSGCDCDCCDCGCCDGDWGCCECVGAFTSCFRCTCGCEYNDCCFNDADSSESFSWATRRASSSSFPDVAPFPIMLSPTIKRASKWLHHHFD